MTQDEVAKIILVIAEKTDSDVLFFNGDLRPSVDHEFIATIISRKRRKNVILFVVTPGGDADVAYRMGRCLQDNYAHVTIVISGWCKSAGTLLAMSAHQLVMGKYGELGPLDVQVGKTDELWEFSSGLDLDAAMEQLEQSAFKMFEDYMLQIKLNSGGRITFKTACDIAGNIVVGLLSPIYSQIDPFKIGETQRSMKIAKDYGKRLNARSKNLNSDDKLDLLVSTYPSHGFVIDFDEARSLFRNVKRPEPELEALQSTLGRDAVLPLGPPGSGTHILRYLSEEPKDQLDLSLAGAEEEHHEPSDTANRRAAGVASGAGAGGDLEGTAPAEKGAVISAVIPLQRSVGSDGKSS